MHFITFFVVSIVMCSFATSLTIISSDVAYPDNNIDNDITNDIVRLNDKQTNILETIYAKQSYGKSHRFYFTTGERVAGDQLLNSSHKQNGWKIKTDAQVNITYQVTDPKIKLTFIQIIVFQESDQNNIHLSEGGTNQGKATITVNANQTRYIAYTADFYGL